MAGSQACEAISKADLGAGPQAAAGSAAKEGNKQTILSSGTLLLFSLEDEVWPWTIYAAKENLLEGVVNVVHVLLLGLGGALPGCHVRCDFGGATHQIGLLFVHVA
jgi:hypothetical protein